VRDRARDCSLARSGRAVDGNNELTHVGRKGRTGWKGRTGEP
jgi:hypothetical protein